MTGIHRTTPVLTVVLLCSAPGLRAQPSSPGSDVTAAAPVAHRFEVGGIGGLACTGSEGSACGGNSGLGVLGGYGSVWLTPQLEAQVRVTRFGRGQWSNTFDVLGSSPRLTVTLSDRDRSRVIAAGHLLYHFGRRPVRWFAGLGYGVRRDHHRQTCTPAECATVPDHLRGGSPLGAETLVGPNLAFAVGLHGRIRSRWVARGGLTLHNWPAESLASTEATAAIGVRF